MRKYLIFLFYFIMVSCASPAQQIMPEVQYNKPINKHFNKNAILVWQTGEKIPSVYEDEVVSNPRLGIIGAMTQVAIRNIEHKNNPDNYIYTYGKAQQVVFMTSLRNILTTNNVFKNVKISTDDNINFDGIIIVVNFEKARVGSQENNLPIILEVKLTIRDKKHFLQKNFFVSSSNAGFWGRSFKNQQLDVSNQLMEKIVNAIIS